MNRRERGSVSLFVVALVVLLLVVGSALLGIGQFAVVAARLRGTADLAALAGANSLAAPCDDAQQVAQANGARLIECVTDEGDITVDVADDPPAFVSRLATLLGADPEQLHARARAGPAA